MRSIRRVLAFSWLFATGAIAQTTVSEEAAHDVVRAPSSGFAVDETARLETDARASLVRRGGPLSPARLEVFGLSGARVGVRLGALPLTDAATGDIDASMIPLSPRTQLRIGNNVSLIPYGAATHGARARLTAGSLGTLAMNGDAHAAAPWGNVTLSGALARTNGAFVFESAPPAQGGPQVRANNDQLRGHALTNVQMTGPVDVQATALASVWRGGIPGFSSAPLPTLRGERALAGAALDIQRHEGAVTLGARAHHQASYRATYERRGGVAWTDAPTFQNEKSALTSRTTSAASRAGTTLSCAFCALAVRAEAGVSQSEIVGGTFARREAFAHAQADARLGEATSRGPSGGVRVAATTRYASDRGALVAGRAEVRGAIGPLFARVRARHHPRYPTLDELYAPQGLVRGNPELVPEALTDITLTLRASLSQFTMFQIDALGGHIAEAILFVNQNAFDITPVNTGPGWRAGVRALARARLLDVVDVHASGRLLTSRLDASGGPLPLAPGLLLRAGASVFKHRRGRVGANVRYRSATAGNVFGTLASAPYTLVDLFAQLRVLPVVSLSARVENAFNVTTAQDAYLFPLPGRLVFWGIEVDV